MSLVAPNLTYLLDVTAWDSEKAYYPMAYQGIQFIQYGMAVVQHQGITYYMNNTVLPQQGVSPASDPAWSVLGGGGSGGNFQGYWEALTNTPELANGTGTAGYYYINTSSGTHSVDFGAGLIAFNQNDSVAYGQDGNWYNAGQQGSIQNIRTDTTDQLSINNVDGTVTINAQTGVTQNKLVIVGAGDVIAQSILPVVSIAKGGTNSSDVLINNMIMGSVAGSIKEIEEIPVGIGAGNATVHNPVSDQDDTLQNTLDALNQSGSGTVSNVSSANADISVANPTTTPVLTLNSGITANKILKLNANAQIPAVDSGTNTLVIDPTDSTQKALNTALSNIYNTSGGTVSSVASANDGLTVANPNTNAIITDVVDNARGLAIDTLGKYIKVDGTTVDFNGSGELMSIGTGSGIVQNIDTNTPNALNIDATDPASPILDILVDNNSGIEISDNGIQTKIDNSTIIYGTGGNLGKLSVNVGTSANQIIQLNGSAQLPSIDIGTNGISINPITQASDTLNNNLTALDNKINAIGAAQQVIYGTAILGNQYIVPSACSFQGKFIGGADLQATGEFSQPLSLVPSAQSTDNISFVFGFKMFSGINISFNPVDFGFDYSISALASDNTTLNTIATGTIANWTFVGNCMYNFTFTTTPAQAGTNTGQFILNITNINGPDQPIQCILQQISVLPVIS